MSLKEKLKKIFNQNSAQEYDFANGGKTAHLTTKKTWFTSSYKMSWQNDEGAQGGESMTAFLQDVRGQGIKKAKAICGITN